MVFGFVAEAANPQVVAGDGQCGAEECCEEGDDFCDYSTLTSGVNLVDCTPYACCAVVTAASWCSFGCLGFAVAAMPSHAFGAVAVSLVVAMWASAVGGFGVFGASAVSPVVAMWAVAVGGFGAFGAVAVSAVVAMWAVAVDGFGCIGGFVVMVAGCCHLFGGGAAVTSGACINAQHGVEAGAIP